LVVRQEIKILVETEQAGNSPQIFPNLRLSPNSGKSQDIVLFRQCLMFYEPASGNISSRVRSFFNGLKSLPIGVRGLGGNQGDQMSL
jgi:hypothetical protein